MEMEMVVAGVAIERHLQLLSIFLVIFAANLVAKSETSTVKLSCA